MWIAHVSGKLMTKLIFQEIEFHKKEQMALREDNRLLEAEVDQLLRDPKTNIRLQMFPEFFPTRPK